MPPRSIQKVRDLMTRICSQDFRVQRCSDLWESMVREEALPPPDLRIVCGDSISLTCHQSVIAGSSSFLRELLMGVSLRNGDDSIRPGDDVTLFVPEVGGIFGSETDIISIFCS